MEVMAKEYPTTEVPKAPVLTRDAWKGADLAGSGEWLYQLSQSAKQELHEALKYVEARNLTAPEFGKEDFPLSTFSAELDEIRHELEGGRGFLVIRGIDRDKYSKKQAGFIFWGIGTHLGTAVSQNGDGHLLGHVRDLSFNFDNPNVRGYQTNTELSYHTDYCDIVALLCLNTARSGGKNQIVSAVAIHNEILERRPDLLEVLYQPFFFDRRGELEREGGEPYFVMPIFSYHDGLVSTRYLRHYIESAQRFPEVPRLTPLQVEALDLVDEIAYRPDMYLSIEQQPGDMVLLNNYPVWHLRTAFEDHDELAKKRHLLRQWLSIENNRPLPETFRAMFDNLESGAVREGIAVRPHPMAPPSADDFWEGLQAGPLTA